MNPHAPTPGTTSLDAIQRELAAQDAAWAALFRQLAELPSHASVAAALAGELTEHLDRIEARVTRERCAQLRGDAQATTFAVAMLQRA